MDFVSIREPRTNSAASSRQKAVRPARSAGATGVLYGVGAYGIWGMLPIYFILLAP